MFGIRWSSVQFTASIQTSMGTPFDMSVLEQIKQAIQPERLIQTAVRLIEIPSPTCNATEVADCLASLLTEEGFDVQRPAAGWAKAPAVVVRYRTPRPGRTLQINGHLDTVHLPFIPPRVEDGILYGSGASDMKGGLAAGIEALRVLRETDTLPAGDILLTAHDLHESPWGDGTQIDGLIDEGYVGDAVLLPEYLHDQLPIAGRGLAIIRITVTRSGNPVHEVLGGIEQPNVITTGAACISRLASLDRELLNNTHDIAGRDSVFVGQIEAGEIFNQSPTQLKLAGTRRWIPGTDARVVRQQFDDLIAELNRETEAETDGNFMFCRDAFELDPGNDFVTAFQETCKAVMGKPLPTGAKPFVDDGNTFMARAGIPAITHGPHATGAHTLQEQVPVDELVRVALVYALTAVSFCPSPDSKVSEPSE